MRTKQKDGWIAVIVCGVIVPIAIAAVALFFMVPKSVFYSRSHYVGSAMQMTDAELIDALAENDMSIASAYRDEVRRRGEAVATMGLTHSDYRVRHRSVQVMSRFTTDTAHAHLVTALKDQDRYVRMAAINGLVLFWEDERSIEIVREHAKTEKDPVTLRLIEHHGIQ